MEAFDATSGAAECPTSRCLASETAVTVKRALVGVAALLAEPQLILREYTVALISALACLAHLLPKDVIFAALHFGGCFGLVEGI